MANRTGKRAGVKLSVVLLSVFLFLLLLSPIAFAATFGDINDDGVINVQDVVLVMKHALDLEELTATQQAVADVNGDGNINVQDVTLIMQYSLGLIDEFPHAALAVSKVTAVNPKQVEVEFNRVLNAEEKAKMAPANFFVALQLTPTIDRVAGVANDGSAVAVMDDSKTVLLTLADGFNFASGSSTNRVTVKKEVGITTDYVVTDLAFLDTSVPTLVSVHTDSPTTIVMTFSEPLKEVVPTNITLNGSLVPLNLGSAVFVDALREVRIETFSNLTAGSYTLAINAGTNLADYSGFSVAPTSKTFTHTPVTTAPTVSVKSATERTVTIEFSRVIDKDTLINNTNVLFRHTFNNVLTEIDGTAVSNPSQDSRTFLVNFGAKTLPAGTVPVWMLYATGTADADKVKDSWGNIIAPATLEAIVTADTTPPTATVTAVTGSSTQIHVQYSEEVIGGGVKANYNLKKGTQSVTIDTVEAVAGSPYKYLITTPTDMQGDHTLTIANITDASPALNAMGTKSYTVTIPDILNPQVNQVMANNATVASATELFVFFTEPMGSSALDTANYRLVTAGNVQYNLPAGTTVTQTASTVKITLPKTLAGIATDLGSNPLTRLFVGNVKDLAGNSVDVITNHDILALAAFAPNPTSVTVRSETQVTFIVSRQLQSADKTKVIRTNGSIEATSLLITNNANGTATITANFPDNTFLPYVNAANNISVQTDAFTDLNGFKSAALLNFAVTVDRAAPYMVSAETIAANQLTITYSENVTNNNEVLTQYVFRLNGVTPVAVTNIAVINDKVTLTLASNVFTTLINYNTSTITYTQASNAVNRTKDVADNSARSPQTLTGITSGF